MPVIGLDLGGTKLAGAILSDEGTLIERFRRSLDGREGDAVGRLISDVLIELLEHARTLELTIKAVGASVPGIYHPQSGTVWAPNIPGWESYPLRALLTEHAGPQVAVAIDSDRACSILGEAALGAARGCAHAIFLAVGTGIGAGILIDGRILRGTHDIAGAIGWMALDQPFRPEYQACGCLETHASGAGIAKAAQQLLNANPGHDGPLGRIASTNINTQDVFAAFEQGDVLAAQVLDVAVSRWGMAVANLVSLFNPQVIVFGGGVFGPAASLLGRIEGEARRWAQPISIQQVAIRVTSLGPDACLLGTGQLALAALGAAD
jgi:glucokinase